MPVADRITAPAKVQFFAGTVCRAVLALASALAVPAIAAGEEAPVKLPDFAVLVLKPVSVERVRPVTGIVLSLEGQVLVPSDFVAEGGEFIVLDGGTDIAAHGRAGTAERTLAGGRLTVLSVPELHRLPAPLSATPVGAGDPVRLAAFPPAEQIAEGMAPLAETRTAAAPASGPDARGGVAVDAAWPNVTGPLLNACGQLVGLHLAAGLPSLEASAETVTFGPADLRAMFDALGLEAAAQPCPLPAEGPAAGPPAAPDPSPAAAPTPESLVAPAGQQDVEAAASREPELGGSLTSDPDRNTPGRTALLMLAALLAVTALAGWKWVRRRPGMPAAASTSRNAGGAATDRRAASSMAAADLEADCVIEASGTLPNGVPFRKSCPVAGAAIHAVIGSGTVELTIESTSVRREHARVAGSAALMTLTDLGSHGETWINRVPCLKGEIMVVSADDTIVLGNVSLQLQIRPRAE